MKRVIIIGGGPAGAITGLVLARMGMEVILLEAAAGAKPKIGECLAPNVVPMLKKLELENLLQNGHKKSYGNQSIWGDHTPTEHHFISTVNGLGIHIDRQLFEHQLTTAAKMAGVDWYYNATVNHVERIGQQWAVTLRSQKEKKPFVADFLVDASGRASITGRCLKVKRRNLDRLVGITAIIENCDLKDSFTLVESTEFGWWYSAGLPGNRLAIAFMTDADLVNELSANKLEHWICLLKELNYTKRRIKHILGQGDSVNTIKLKVKQAGSSILEQITGQNWLSVGDAACTYDPISSFGITAAITSGYYAGHAIHNHLNGNGEAFLTYTFVMEKMYADYLSLIQQAYQQEQRWPDSVFWERRHRLNH